MIRRVMASSQHKEITMKITKIILLSTLLIASNVAMAQDYAGSSYNGNTAQTMQDVTLGQVISMREVTIDGTTQLGQYAGSGLGAAIGGILGNTLGKNNTSKALGTVVLGAAGAIGGNYATKAINRETANEYIIRLDSGRVVAVTQSQESTNEILVGDQVRILQNGRVRIVKMM